MAQDDNNLSGVLDEEGQNTIPAGTKPVRRVKYVRLGQEAVADRGLGLQGYVTRILIDQQPVEEFSNNELKEQSIIVVEGHNLDLFEKWAWVQPGKPVSFITRFLNFTSDFVSFNAGKYQGFVPEDTEVTLNFYSKANPAEIFRLPFKFIFASESTEEKKKKKEAQEVEEAKKIAEGQGQRGPGSIDEVLNKTLGGATTALGQGLRGSPEAVKTAGVIPSAAASNTQSRAETDADDGGESSADEDFSIEEDTVGVQTQTDSGLLSSTVEIPGANITIQGSTVSQGSATLSENSTTENVSATVSAQSIAGQGGVSISQGQTVTKQTTGSAVGSGGGSAVSSWQVLGSSTATQESTVKSSVSGGQQSQTSQNITTEQSVDAQQQTQVQQSVQASESVQGPDIQSSQTADVTTAGEFKGFTAAAGSLGQKVSSTAGANINLNQKTQSAGLGSANISVGSSRTGTGIMPPVSEPAPKSAGSSEVLQKTKDEKPGEEKAGQEAGESDSRLAEGQDNKSTVDLGVAPVVTGLELNLENRETPETDKPKANAGVDDAETQKERPGISKEGLSGQKPENVDGVVIPAQYADMIGKLDGRLPGQRPDNIEMRQGAEINTRTKANINANQQSGGQQGGESLGNEPRQQPDDRQENRPTAPGEKKGDEIEDKSLKDPVRQQGGEPGQQAAPQRSGNRVQYQDNAEIPAAQDSQIIYPEDPAIDAMGRPRKKQAKEQVLDLVGKGFFAKYWWPVYWSAFSFVAFIPVMIAADIYWFMHSRNKERYPLDSKQKLATVILNLIPVAAIALLFIILIAACNFKPTWTIIVASGGKQICEVMDANSFGISTAIRDSVGPGTGQFSYREGPLSIAKWQNEIRAAGLANNLDACVLQTVIKKESGNNDSEAIGCDCLNERRAQCYLPGNAGKPKFGFNKADAPEYGLNWNSCSYGIGLTQWTIYPRGSTENYKRWMDIGTPSRSILGRNGTQWYTVTQLLDPAVSLDLTAAKFRRELNASRGELREAFRSYNGSGPMAEKYANDAMNIYNWDCVRITGANP